MRSSMTGSSVWNLHRIRSISMASCIRFVCQIHGKETTVICSFYFCAVPNCPFLPEEESPMSNFQRRDFLTGAAAFAAATTATLVGTRRAEADDQPPLPIRGKEGAPIIGPTNPTREAQNTDRLAPPKTDHGTMPNLRFSFADVHNRLQPGGWARQVTGRELQIAQALNCVNMRLKAGAVREMHWHVPDEWGFVLKGRMRITAVDQDGHAFQDDISEGNIWNFPG